MKKPIINTIPRGVKSYRIPALAFALVLSAGCSDHESGYTVLKGPFRQSVIETGELQSVNAVTIMMPNIDYKYASRLKIIDMAEHGKTVHKGDPVVIVDPASVQKFIIEKRESLENEIATSNKLRAQLKNNLQDLKAQLRNEQSSYDIKKLQLETSAFESEATRKIRELEFRQSEIRLNKLKKNLELRPKLDSLDYRIQLIKIAQREDELRAAEETLVLFTVRTPLDGVFVVQRNVSTGQTIKVGDEVYLGNSVAKIPDINRMKVNGIIMENDISRIKTGQDVIIRLDALPSVAFNGTISKVGKVCIPQDDKKVFLTEVLISETDLRLKPGMTVSCEYITYESKDEIYVPNTCILDENKHFYLFVRKRGKIRKTEVTPGPSNNMFTVVSGELKPGQALEKPDNILTE